MPKTPRKAHCWSSLELLGRGVHLTSVPFPLPFLPSFLGHWDVPKTVTIVMRGHKSLWSMYTQSIINTWQGEELSTVILIWGLCISLLINPQFWALCCSRNTKLQAPIRQAHKNQTYSLGCGICVSMGIFFCPVFSAQNAHKAKLYS